MSLVRPERWRILSPYLDEVLDLPPPDRPGWLARLRARDADLAADLETLLSDHTALSRAGFLAAAAEPLAAPVAEGTRVGAYTLRSLLGRGGMGTVWLADRADGRFTGQVAVKLLNVSLIGRGGEERFRREGSLLARLTHPHVAHLVDAGVTTDGQPYLVIEHVEGDHIDRYCASHELSIDARLRLFLDVLDAVAHAHAHLIVHRDLKPSNVLVRTDGAVKLLDFGIAKLLEPDDQGEGEPPLTAEGALVLTPEYAAPEQLTGAPVTTATDVYALGLLLYVLLGAPHPASRHGAPADLLKAVVETDPPPPSAVAPAGRLLRGDLDTIVARALKKDPAERYGSVGAFADDLRRYLRHEPVSARPDSLAYRAGKFVRRHARATAAACVVLLMVATIVAFYTQRLTAERDRARLEATKASRITDLLTSLMTGADPYASHDREPTVRNILDAGADRVRRELGDEPELRAEMLNVIGRVHQRLGHHDTARPLLEEALAIERSADLAGSARLARTLNDLGVLHRERGDAAAAIPLLDEAVALRRRLSGSRHQDVAVTLVELGRAFDDVGDADRAEPLYREALSIRLEAFGERHRETATSLTELGLLLRHRGDIAGAEQYLRQALDISLAVLDADHPNVGAAWNNLGLVLLDKGAFADAEPLLRRALAIRTLHFGERHASLATNQANLAAALRHQGRRHEAAALLDEAVRLTRDGLGDDHPTLGGLLYSVGTLHLARGDTAAAERVLRDTLDRQRRTLPDADWRVAATRSALGEALAARGALDEAEALLVAARDVLRDVPGRQGREAAATRQRLETVQAMRRSARAGGVPLPPLVSSLPMRLR